MIAVSHLGRRFGVRTAVDDVTFEVQAAEIVALLGPNGAGKTTTMRMMAGLIAPSHGSIAVDGLALTPETSGALRSRIGFLTESPGLWDRLTVRENLRTYAGLYGLAQPERVIDSVLERFELADRASTPAAELSKGMRQKVALARALLHDPDILLLDEPTSGLDPEITRSVRQLLEERRARGCAILVATHNLDEAERLADRIGVIHTQLLALDTAAMLRKRFTAPQASIRLRGIAAAFLPQARAIDPAAAADGGVLTLALVNAERDMPTIVRALVAAGADLIEARVDVPTLEDVYLALVNRRRERAGRPES
ncbi:MAG TPA: ABC transporter ATP-binding protein [Vicinamibacterales bacterium]